MEAVEGPWQAVAVAEARLVAPPAVVGA